MLKIFKSRWRSRWHVYEVDTGGTAWVATFSSREVAETWVRWCYDNDLS